MIYKKLLEIIEDFAQRRINSSMINHEFIVENATTGPLIFLFIV